MQSAKTALRLKRDSQGNYSYQYVADDEGVDDARAKLAEAQNDLYNFDKERYKSNLDDMLAAWKDFQSEYKDIIDDVSLTEE
jgi:competence protein ComGC